MVKVSSRTSVARQATGYVQNISTFVEHTISSDRRLPVVIIEETHDAIETNFNSNNSLDHGSGSLGDVTAAERRGAASRPTSRSDRCLR
jgi:hypothetical protein